MNDGDMIMDARTGRLYHCLGEGFLSGYIVAIPDTAYYDHWIGIVGLSNSLPMQHIVTIIRRPEE